MRSTDNRSGVGDLLPLRGVHTGRPGAVGMSIGDYLDDVMNGTPGATRSTIDALRALGVYAAAPDTVLEIGPPAGTWRRR
ncbi:hypothetical protein ACFXGT_10130 [Streptomyces sp. NPDC059352]|uniref:hypothetical protein n=1 Tax=Streptomyces sp. NPDC059352 TaxID=3346810 RepID=UPI0036CA5C89